MKSIRRYSTILVLTAAIGLTAWAANNEAKEDDDENEQTVAIDALPAAVRNAVLQAAPGEIIEAELETEHGVQVYEVEVRGANGITEVTVSPEGKVLETEVEGDEDDEEDDEHEENVELPPAVTNAAMAVAPSAKIIGGEKEGDGLYEVELKSADGTIMEVVVDADGRVVEIEEEISESDLPASVKAALSQLMPAGKTVEVEKKMVVVYEIEKVIDGKEYNIKLDHAGRVLSLSTEDDD